jgi:hypothetical protein
MTMKNLTAAIANAIVLSATTMVGIEHVEARCIKNCTYEAATHAGGHHYLFRTQWGFSGLVRGGWGLGGIADSPWVGGSIIGVTAWGPYPYGPYLHGMYPP